MLRQAQPGGGTGYGAIAPGQQFGDPFHRFFTAAHQDQRTDDIADHVMKECIALHGHFNHFALAADLQ